MIAVAIAVIAAGTILTLGAWSHRAFRDFLAKTSPHPINVEDFVALQQLVADIDRRSIRTESKLTAQGYRNG